MLNATLTSNAKLNGWSYKPQQTRCVAQAPNDGTGLPDYSPLW
jgi:hypothetical protein